MHCLLLTRLRQRRCAMNFSKGVIASLINCSQSIFRPLSPSTCRCRSCNHRDEVDRYPAALPFERDAFGMTDQQLCHAELVARSGQIEYGSHKVATTRIRNAKKDTIPCHPCVKNNCTTFAMSAKSKLCKPRPRSLRSVGLAAPK